MASKDGSDYSTYPLGDFQLKSGGVLKDAFLAYVTFGDPSSPAIVYPTWYSGLHESQEPSRDWIIDVRCLVMSHNFWLIGDDKALSPKKYFIIVPAMLGNGQSTSPSNTPSPRPFPKILFYDNVRAQHLLVTEHFKINKLHAVLGWSMGAGQTYQWATQYPDMVERIAPFCGSARTSPHNQVFIEGFKAAALAAKGVSSAGIAKGEELDENGKYVPWTPRSREVGLKALGRVYAGWGFSQPFYRHEVWKTNESLGFKSLEPHFMVDFWEAWSGSKDIEDMMVLADVWQSGDISQQEPYNGDFEKALASIKAKALVMPSQTDLYFPPEDSEYEVRHMSPGVGELAVMPTIWGHMATLNEASSEDVKWLDDNLKRLFV